MSGPKSRPTGVSVSAVLDSIDAANLRADAKRVASMMRRATGKRARMLAAGIDGYGRCVMPGFDGYGALPERLFRHRRGKGCVCVRRLEDVDTKVLEAPIRKSVEDMRNTYETV